MFLLNLSSAVYRRPHRRDRWPASARRSSRPTLISRKGNPPRAASLPRITNQPMVTQDHLKIALTRFPRLYRLARRPYALFRFLAKEPHEADYAVFALFPDRDGLFLDVGAN